MKKQFRWLFASLLLCMFLFASVTHVEASSKDPTTFSYVADQGSIDNAVSFEAATLYLTTTFTHGYVVGDSVPQPSPEARCNGPT